MTIDKPVRDRVLPRFEHDMGTLSHVPSIDSTIRARGLQHSEFERISTAGPLHFTRFVV